MIILVTDLEGRSDLVAEEPEEFEIGVVVGEEGERQEEGVLHPEERHQHQRRSSPLPLGFCAGKESNTKSGLVKNRLARPESSSNTNG